VTGDELKKQRIELGLSQAQFGALLGVSRYTIARSENGTPSENVELRLALAMKKKLFSSQRAKRQDIARRRLIE
jgi:DNA-binding XRE family transcriptional regulator